MFLHKNKKMSIYFSDASQTISIQEIAQQKCTQNLEIIADQLDVSQLIFLRQEHGVQGVCIEKNDDQSYFFQSSGDYIITQKKDCGIGVVTADCLPIVLYDPINHTAGIVHAGWKGSVAGVFTIAVQAMTEKYQTNLENLEIYFGPAARPCCYEVQQDFVDHFQTYENSDQFFMKKNEKIYFDSTLFTTNIARSLGIKPKNIYTTYNVCTICDKSYCSYRRDKEKAQRQITLISLH